MSLPADILRCASLEEQNLVDWARPYLRRPDRLHRVMDPSLEGSYSEKAAEIAAMVAHNCLHSVPRSRPTMLEVVEALEPLLDMRADVPVGAFVYTVPLEVATDRAEGSREKDGGHGATVKKKTSLYADNALQRVDRRRYASLVARKESRGSPRQTRDRGA